MSTVKTEFLVDRRVEVPGGDDMVYEKNKVYELSPDSHEHFVSRGQAQKPQAKTGGAKAKTGGEQDADNADK